VPYPRISIAVGTLLHTWAIKTAVHRTSSGHCPTGTEETLISILSLPFPSCISKQNVRLHASFFPPVLTQNFRQLTSICPPRRLPHSMNVKQQCALSALGWVTAWGPLLPTGFSTRFQALKRARIITSSAHCHYWRWEGTNHHSVSLPSLFVLLSRMSNIYRKLVYTLRPWKWK
jgi:hypothetical protein